MLRGVWSRAARGVAVTTIGAGMLVFLSACSGGTGTPAPDAEVSQEVEATSLTVQELIPLLTRYGVGPNQIGLDVIYASQLFFDVTGIDAPDANDTRSTLLFIVEETIHDGDLAETPPAAFLVLEDGTRVAPNESELVTEDPHHRTSRVLFDRPDGWPEMPTDDAPLTVRLVVPMEDGAVTIANTFEWRLPLQMEPIAPAAEGG
jgi:hypothetical protein